MEKHDPMHDPPPPYPGNTSSAPAAGQPPPMGFVDSGPGPNVPLYPHIPPQTSAGPHNVPHAKARPQPGVQMVDGQVMAHVVGPEPAQMICPSCQATISTRIEPKVTTRTHIMAGVLCLLFGLFCVWLPYCLDNCKNADHYCPNCEAYIGTYTR